MNLHGTVTASIDMQIQGMDASEEVYIVSVAFIDMNAGFDTVHSFLLRKLQMMGYADSTLD